jgi:LysM repeat protein
MTYELHEEYSISFTGGALDPKGWAIHWWGDPNQKPTFWGTVNVLLERGRQESASVNFVAEAGIVACLISPFTVAWAQGDGGNGWGNRNLVSVECNPRCTAEDRETVAELIADQNIQNGIPIVLYPHKNFTATQCPGVWEQWIPWLTARAKQIVAEKSGKATAPAPAAPAPKPTPAPSTPASGATTIQRGEQEIHWVVEKGDTLSKIAAYYYNDGSNSNISKLASYNGIKNPNAISVGQKVWIPGPMLWTIEAPDTVESICNYYGISWQWLAARNPNQVDGPNTELYIGNVLTIL